MVTRILALVDLRDLPAAAADAGEPAAGAAPSPPCPDHWVPPAVGWAVAWAAHQGAEVEFLALRPHTPVPMADSPAFTGTSPAALEQALQAQTRQALSNARDVAEAAGVMSHARMARDDDPARAVLDVAASRRCELVVVASDGRNAVMRLLTGSAIPGLVTTSPVPLLIVPCSAASPPPIVGPDAPAPATPVRVMAVLEDRQGSEAAVQRGIALARLLKAELLIAQPVPREMPLALDGSAIVPLADERLADALRERAASRLATWMQRASDAGIPVQSLRIDGAFTGHTLADLATRQGCAMVVVATEGRNAVMRMVVGSVIPGLITTARMPLLIVRDALPDLPAQGGRRRGAAAGDAYTSRS